MKQKAANKAPQRRATLSTTELSRRTYAIFGAHGVHVDLDRFFSTDEGREEFKRVAAGADDPDRHDK